MRYKVFNVAVGRIQCLRINAYDDNDKLTQTTKSTGLSAGKIDQAKEWARQLEDLLNSFDRLSDASQEHLALFYHPKVVQIGLSIPRDTVHKSATANPVKDPDFINIETIGEMGAGKSTLINALIGKPGFLATSVSRTTLARCEIVHLKTASENCFDIDISVPTKEKIHQLFEDRMEKLIREIAYLVIMQLSDPKDFNLEKALEDLFLLFRKPGNSQLDLRLVLSEEELHQQVNPQIRALFAKAKDEIASSLEPINATNAQASTLSEEQLDTLIDGLIENRLRSPMIDFRSYMTNTVASKIESFVSDFSGTLSGDQKICSFPKKSWDDTIRIVARSIGFNDVGRLITPLVENFKIAGRFTGPISTLGHNVRISDNQGLGHTLSTRPVPLGFDLLSRLSTIDIILFVQRADASWSPTCTSAIEALYSNGMIPRTLLIYTRLDELKKDEFKNSQEEQKVYLRNLTREFVANMAAERNWPVSIGSKLFKTLENQSQYYAKLNNPSELDADERFSGLLNHVKLTFERPVELKPQVQATPNQKKTKSEPAQALEPRQINWTSVIDNYKSHLGENLERELERVLQNWSDRLDDEHWTRIRALCRRLGELGETDYQELKPLTDIFTALTKCSRQSLERSYTDSDIDEITRSMSYPITQLVKDKVWTSELSRWRDAYRLKGMGQGARRANRVLSIMHNSTNIGFFRESINKLSSILNRCLEGKVN